MKRSLAVREGNLVKPSGEVERNYKVAAKDSGRQILRAYEFDLLERVTSELRVERLRVLDQTPSVLRRLWCREEVTVTLCLIVCCGLDLPGREKSPQFILRDPGFLRTSLGCQVAVIPQNPPLHPAPTRGQFRAENVERIHGRYPYCVHGFDMEWHVSKINTECVRLGLLRVSVGFQHLVGQRAEAACSICSASWLCDFPALRYRRSVSLDVCRVNSITVSMEFLDLASSRMLPRRTHLKSLSGATSRMALLAAHIMRLYVLSSGRSKIFVPPVVGLVARCAASIAAQSIGTVAYSVYGSCDVSTFPLAKCTTIVCNPVVASGGRSVTSFTLSWATSPGRLAHAHISTKNAFRSVRVVVPRTCVSVCWLTSPSLRGVSVFDSCRMKRHASFQFGSCERYTGAICGLVYCGSRLSAPAALPHFCSSVVHRVCASFCCSLSKERTACANDLSFSAPVTWTTRARRNDMCCARVRLARPRRAIECPVNVVRRLLFS
eukprot:PhM_4_TR3069/c1_g1_i3/m.91109